MDFCAHVAFLPKHEKDQKNGYGSKPYTHGEHQNSWQMDVHPTKMVLVGIDPYPLGNPPYPDSNGRPP